MFNPESFVEPNLTMAHASSARWRAVAPSLLVTVALLAWGARPALAQMRASAPPTTGLAPAAPPASVPAPVAPPGFGAAGDLPDGYSSAIHDAVIDHDAGRFGEARAQFLRAHAIFPNARTLRGLGMVEFELRNYGECVRYLEQALVSTVRPLSSELASDTRRLLQRARAYVGEVRVEMDPGTASVVIDGVTVATGPEASFVLVVGNHELEFRAHGRVPEKRAISIRGGDQKRLRVTLAASPGPVLASHDGAPGPLHQSERTPLVKRWWLWTAVGVAVAGATVGAVLVSRQAGTRERETELQKTEHDVGVVVMTLGAAR